MALKRLQPRIRRALVRGCLFLLLGICLQGPSWAVTVRRVPISSRSLIYDPDRAILYASSGDSIVPMDPIQGTRGTPLPVKGGPGKIVISDDGQFLYAVTDASDTVTRVSIPAGKVDLRFQVDTVKGEFHRKVID